MPLDIIPPTSPWGQPNDERKLKNDVQSIREDLDSLSSEVSSSEAGFSHPSLPSIPVTSGKNWRPFEIEWVDSTDIKVHAGRWTRDAEGEEHRVSMTISTGPVVRSMDPADSATITLSGGPSDGVHYITLTLTDVDSSPYDNSLNPDTLIAADNGTSLPGADNDCNVIVIGMCTVASNVITKVQNIRNWEKRDQFIIADNLSIGYIPNDDDGHKGQLEIKGWEDATDSTIDPATDYLHYKDADGGLSKFISPNVLLADIISGGSVSFNSIDLSGNATYRHAYLTWTSHATVGVADQNTDHDKRYFVKSHGVTNVQATCNWGTAIGKALNQQVINLTGQALQDGTAGAPADCLTWDLTSVDIASTTILNVLKTTAASSGAGAIDCLGGIYAAAGIYVDIGGATNAGYFAGNGLTCSICTASYGIDTQGINVGTGGYFYNGTRVVYEQGAAVANATGAGDVVAQLNALLARVRTHGLIAT